MRTENGWTDGSLTPSTSSLSAMFWGKTNGNLSRSDIVNHIAFAKKKNTKGFCVCTVTVKKMCCEFLYLRLFLIGKPQGREVRNTKQSWSGAFPMNFALSNFTFTLLGSSRFKSQLRKYWNCIFHYRKLPETELKYNSEKWMCSLYPLLIKSQICLCYLF